MLFYRVALQKPVRSFQATLPTESPNRKNTASSLAGSRSPSASDTSTVYLEGGGHHWWDWTLVKATTTDLVLRHSMYAIYAYIGVVWGVNVGIYMA